jgi:hypothetical protein
VKLKLVATLERSSADGTLLVDGGLEHLLVVLPAGLSHEDGRALVAVERLAVGGVLLHVVAGQVTLESIL